MNVGEMLVFEQVVSPEAIISESRHATTVTDDRLERAVLLATANTGSLELPGLLAKALPYTDGATTAVDITKIVRRSLSEERHLRPGLDTVKKYTLGVIGELNDLGAERTDGSKVAIIYQSIHRGSHLVPTFEGVAILAGMATRLGITFVPKVIARNVQPFFIPENSTMTEEERLAKKYPKNTFIRDGQYLIDFDDTILAKELDRYEEMQADGIEPFVVRFMTDFSASYGSSEEVYFDARLAVSPVQTYINALLYSRYVLQKTDVMLHDIASLLGLDVSRLHGIGQRYKEFCIKNHIQSIIASHEKGLVKLRPNIVILDDRPANKNYREVSDYLETRKPRRILLPSLTNAHKLTDPERSWVKKKACAGLDTALFFEDFEEHPEALEFLKGVCASCCVVSECYDYAVTTKQEGYWAGMTEKERYNNARAIKRQKRAESAVSE